MEQTTPVFPDHSTSEAAGSPTFNFPLQAYSAAPNLAHSLKVKKKKTKTCKSIHIPLHWAQQEGWGKKAAASSSRLVSVPRRMRRRRPHQPLAMPFPRSPCHHKQRSLGFSITLAILRTLGNGELIVL